MVLGRRTIAILAALLAASGGRLGAQGVSVGGRLGAVAGAVWFEDDEANDQVKPKLGVQIGGAVVYELTSIVSVRTELWWVQKGWKETQAGGGRRLAYVELPLLLTATLPWRTAPQLLAGVSASRELTCTVTRVREVGSVGCDDLQVEWHHEKTQVATWFGFGVRRRYGSSHLELQLLGSLHLTDVNRERLPIGYSRLSSFTLSAAYMIALGGSAR